MTDLEHETPFEFPCQFPIKAMGRNTATMEAAVVEIVRRHVEDSGSVDIKTRESKGRKFVSVTVEINAQSKAQLDAIYLDLSACADVVMTL
jgi:putative lipoic acid-binding regulatory protein